MNLSVVALRVLFATDAPAASSPKHIHVVARRYGILLIILVAHPPPKAASVTKATMETGMATNETTILSMTFSEIFLIQLSPPDNKYDDHLSDRVNEVVTTT